MGKEFNMKRFSTKYGKDIENKKIDAFLEAIIAVSKRYGYAISHEDIHGSFEIVTKNEGYFNWLLDANDNTGAEDERTRDDRRSTKN